MNTRPDSTTRATGYFIPSDEVELYLHAGWRVAEIEDGPVYAANEWALLQPPATGGERAP